jgi:DNA-binding IclR family transcriptional regulator
MNERQGRITTMAAKPAKSAKKASPAYSVPALEKGLDILERLSASPQPMSLAELARDLDRGSAEIFRMLVCLERRAYIRREPVSGKYTPTLRLFEIAQAHAPLRALLEAAREPMREATGILRESVHLSVLDRGRLLVVAREESPENIRLSIEVGASFEAAKTASGRLLLDAAAKEVSARDETIEGVDDAVVRIGSPDAAVHAALAVSWLRIRKGAKKPATVLAALHAAARKIQVNLGI